jgi:hypothetical protein
MTGSEPPVPDDEDELADVEPLVEPATVVPELALFVDVPPAPPEPLSEQAAAVTASDVTRKTTEGRRSRMGASEGVRIWRS